MTKENVLIIGGGGREHALAWKISQSDHVGKVYVAKGNAGTGKDFENVDLEAKTVHDFGKLEQFARMENIALVVVGPEAPLALGLVDYWHACGAMKRGNLIFGMTQAAAKVESSKVFAKLFMRQYSIATAPFSIFRNPKYAIEHVRKQHGLFVVKADGLAEGKGAIVCHNHAEGIDAIERMMVKKEFKDAGNTVIIEDFMPGIEASILALSDGTISRVLVASQDHKPVYDGDEGPNTGGMGAYAPAPIVTPQLMSHIQKNIIQKTIDNLSLQGTPFVGCLYAGLMIESGNVRVVEFNCRFGDPETQVVLMQTENDLYTLLKACATKTLSAHEIKTRPGASCCVVLASAGYPGAYQKGKIITGIDQAELDSQLKVFHAGTALRDGNIVTNGGRVLGVTAHGDDLAEAIERSYRGVEQIHFDGMQYRKDIGQKGL